MIVLTVKKFLSYVKVKHLLMQLVPVAPRLLHVAAYEERASILSAAALILLEYCDAFPPEPSFLR